MPQIPMIVQIFHYCWLRIPLSPGTRPLISIAGFCWRGLGANIEDGSSLFIGAVDHITNCANQYDIYFILGTVLYVWYVFSTRVSLAQTSLLHQHIVAVYVRFKSVNLKKILQTKNIILVGPLLARGPGPWPLAGLSKSCHEPPINSADGIYDWDRAFSNANANPFFLGQ